MYHSKQGFAGDAGVVLPEACTGYLRMICRPDAGAASVGSRICRELSGRGQTISHFINEMRRVLLPLRAASRPVPTFRSRPTLACQCKRSLVSASDLQFGQPLHETHPHLIKPGERKTRCIWNRYCHTNQEQSRPA
jgi:hypothetical protein